MRVVEATVIALLASLLYLCTTGLLAPAPLDKRQQERQSMAGVGGAAIVFVLTLWAELS